MKAVIFAGGHGTRISEESGVRPKPMVEIGGKPILWHIMKTFSSFGVNDFIILCGYKSHVIKDYFANYSLYNADVTFDVGNHTMDVHKNGAENWKVTLLETGEDSSKSERLLKAKDYIGDEEFFLTYGDGVSDINLTELLKFHKENDSLVTLTAVQPPGRFGGFILSQGQTQINSFKEKPTGDGAWINGGYMVVNPQALSFIRDPKKEWEEDAMEVLAQDGKLSAYVHDGFWHPMDTLRDKTVLEKMWDKNEAPWKVW